jgi:hypothetical protein
VKGASTLLGEFKLSVDRASTLCSFGVCSILHPPFFLLIVVYSGTIGALPYFIRLLTTRFAVTGTTITSTGPIAAFHSWMLIKVQSCSKWPCDNAQVRRTLQAQTWTRSIHSAKKRSCSFTKIRKATYAISAPFTEHSIRYSNHLHRKAFNWDWGPKRRLTKACRGTGVTAIGWNGRFFLLSTLHPLFYLKLRSPRDPCFLSG